MCGIALTLISADVDIKYIGGADPEMVFLDNGEETEVRSIAPKNIGENTLSKFSWHNIFMNFVINLKIMKILFTNWRS